MRPIHTAVSCLLAICLVLLGCDDDPGIRSYEVPAEPDSARDTLPGLPPTNPPFVEPIARPTAGPTYQWELPEGWRKIEIQRRMRLATFHAGSEDDPVEVAVSLFPDNVGGLTRNLNRWRDQLGLPPVDDAAADEQMRRLEDAKVEGARFVELAGTGEAEGQSQPGMMVAMVPETGQTWFVRITDDVDVIAEHREALLTFARTLPPERIPPPSGPSSVAAGPSTDPYGSPEERHAAGKTHWNTPPGWTPDPDKPAMLEAAYAAGPEGKVRITLMSLVADGGGMMRNINRWRAQVGLPPVSDTDPLPATQVPVSGSPGMLVTMEGTPTQAMPNSPLEVGVPAKTVAIIVARPDTTWFIKMTGPRDSVNAQRQAFQQLIGSIHFH